MASITPSLSTENITNFRDVASTINRSDPSNQPTLKAGLFYRSALPSTASAEARENLSRIYKIKTILDLRTDTEIGEQEKEKPSPPPPKRHVKNPSTSSLSSLSPLPSTTPASTPSPPKTTHISLNGPSYSLALIKQLPYHQTLKLALLYTIPSYRTSAISILGKNVMTARGLSGLAIDTLTHSTAEIAHVLTLLSDSGNYPVLVHCTQGKDRTGLVVLLVCLLCGAGVEDIDRDYMLSGDELAPEREERVREIAKIGLPASFAGCEEGWVGVVGGWLEREWGGVEGYLEKGCGVEKETVEGVRSILMAGRGGD